MPLLLLPSLAAAAAALALAPEPRRGVWGYFCYQDTASIAGSEPNPDSYPSRCWEEQTVNAPPAMSGTLMMLKWRHLEPSPGEYDWSALDANITKAAALDLQLLIAIEVCKADPKDEATPDWLYDQAPGVNFTHTPRGTVVPPNTTNPHRCPYYLDRTFQALFRRLISALATHLASLPKGSHACN
jgi:beta-galactosidase GanA